MLEVRELRSLREILHSAWCEGGLVSHEPQGMVLKAFLKKQHSQPNQL
jgi:predicted nuclease of restriction endonuclease-like (RecB) superfamily